tara:strand:- start:319 stop:546 length:228 start_codon:yes stop_codon:yes gene_type:complete
VALGAYLSEAKGKTSFETLCQKEIFEPLGMHVDAATLVFQGFRDIHPNFSQRAFLFNEKRLLLLSKKGNLDLLIW